MRTISQPPRILAAREMERCCATTNHAFAFGRRRTLGRPGAF
jgi:hypothetical protein